MSQIDYCIRHMPTRAEYYGRRDTPKIAAPLPTHRTVGRTAAQDTARERSSWAQQLGAPSRNLPCSGAGLSPPLFVSFAVVPSTIGESPACVFRRTVGKVVLAIETVSVGLQPAGSPSAISRVTGC